MSPFSAQISLKKSLVIDKSGVHCLPPDIHAVSEASTFKSDTLTFVKKTMQLENDLDNLKVELARVVDDRDEAYKKINYLEAECASMSIKHEKDDANLAKIESLHIELKRIDTENLKYSDLVRKQTEEINDLRKSVKVKTDVSNQMNRKFSEFKTKSEKDNAALKKSHRAEVKSWKQELGNERKEKIKLEKKLEKLMNENATEVDKKIIDEEVALVVEESVDPTCENCDDTFNGKQTEPEHDGCHHAI